MSERNEAASGTISVFGKLQAKAGQEKEMRDTVSPLVEPSRSAPGCIQYTLFEDKNTPGLFFTFEQWESEKALQVHLDTNKDTFVKIKTMLQGDLQTNVCQVVVAA